MKTYNQQRREFVLLAMKLIEKDGLTFRALYVYVNTSILHFNVNDEVFIINGYDEQNEAEIQKLRDLLRGGK